MRRTVVPLGLVGLVAVVAVPAAFAAGSVNPPAGTPDLAAMVIQPSDLEPGVDVVNQAYVKPPTGFTAAYSSVLSGATTMGGTEYASIEDDVALAPSSVASGNLFLGEQAVLTTRKGRAAIAKSVVKDYGKKAHLKTSDIKFGAPINAGIGTASVAELLTIKVKHNTVPEAIVSFYDGDTYADVALVGKLNAKLSLTDATALGSTIDSHIHTVLGATGTTGTTGTS
jgi:hypothetical protein